MSRDEIVSSDPLNRVTTRLKRDNEGLVLEHRADYTPLLDENKRMNTSEQRGKQSRLAARIPPHLYYIDWPVEFQIRHGEHPHRVPGDKRREVRRLWREFVNGKINDVSFRHLRVDGGGKKV